MIDPDELIDRIEAMRAEPKYAWADKTLAGIAETIQRTKTASARQHEAVENIKNAKRSEDDGALPTDRLKGSRRYEGFGR